MDKKYFIKIIVMAMFLGGCSFSPILAGIGGAVLTGGASVLGAAIKEDVTQAAEWRGRHQALVSQIEAAIMAQARALEDTDWNAAMALYDRAREFSIDNQPQILLERLRARLAARDANQSAGE